MRVIADEAVQLLHFRRSKLSLRRNLVLGPFSLDLLVLFKYVTVRQYCARDPLWASQ